MLDALKGMYWASQGKRFGNQVADLLGVHRGLYHCAMEEGGCQMHLIKLYQLKEDGESIERVALHSCQFLFPGLEAIQARFGKQSLVDEARSRVLAYTAQA